MKRRRGFTMTEVLFALALLAVAATIWASAMARVRTDSLGLADNRDATRLAEQTLLALRSGQSQPASAASATVDVQPCTDGAAVAGHQWVQVRVTIGLQHQSLVGLVPAGAIKGDKQ